MNLTLAQINPTVGDFEKNYHLHQEAIEQAGAKKNHLIIFSELSLTGYPPKDLLEKPVFMEEYLRYESKICTLSEKYKELIIVFGGLTENPSEIGKKLYNSAIVIQNGSVIKRIHKVLLPTYDVFDESRYFESGTEPGYVECNGKKIGISICEDIWNLSDNIPQKYQFDPIQHLIENHRIDILLNLSASPYYAGKHKERRDLLANTYAKYQTPVFYINQVGGNDELIFDGGSLIIDSSGTLIQMPLFHCAIGEIELNEKGIAISQNGFLANTDLPELANIYEALLLGIRDYTAKCKFKKVVLGLSGGIDSALVAALAAKALGPENVHAIMMPSAFSSKGSIDDSVKLADNLGISCEKIEIEPIFQQFLTQLKPTFKDLPFNVAEENIQARTRGTLLMAYSNKFGNLLLTTGNKSELAMGYCTLYGDMAGGLAVIADLFKTTVYDLCRYINREEEIIPIEIIDKAPSAELRPDQKDSDSLPPYEVLDGILENYIVDHKSVEKIVEAGYNRALVQRIVRSVDINEYKRYQTPPCLKISVKAFGFGRRMPIAKGFCN